MSEDDRLRSAASLQAWSSRNGRPLDADPKVANSARDLGLLPPAVKFLAGEPPTTRWRSRRGSFREHWAPVVEQLRSRPGTWADLGEHPRHLARSLARVFSELEVSSSGTDPARVYGRVRPGP